MPMRTDRTKWGGLADGGFQPSGFFRVERKNNVWWLVDPDGGRFLSKGVNTVRFDQDEIQNSKRIPYQENCQKKYGTIEKWRAAVAARLKGWGFNTIGSWSDVGVAISGTTLAATPNLDLAMSYAWQWNDRHQGEPRQEFPDVFDPQFDAHIRGRARELCAAHTQARHILGWFIDNELRWGADWRGTDGLLALFLNHAAGTPGRVAAEDWVRGRGGDPTKAPSPADNEAFSALVADRYFALTVAAIKAADPNHLVLGCRFALPPPASAIAAAGRHVDVITFNCYDINPSKTLALYAATGRPCLIGEFSFRGDDAGLPNTRGAGPQVPTQTERAAAFRHYVTTALSDPALVGFHWFEHADQPAEGRFDGENSNYGTVTIADVVYDEITRTMTAVNDEVDALHAGTAAGA